MTDRLSATEVIDLVLAVGSFVCWSTQPTRGAVSRRRRVSSFLTGSTAWTSSTATEGMGSKESVPQLVTTRG